MRQFALFDYNQWQYSRTLAPVVYCSQEMQPAVQPTVLASAVGNAVQAPPPPVRTARPDSVTLPCFTPGVTVDASMLIMVTWHGHPVTAADSQP